jgi:hypothetical protein
MTAALHGLPISVADLRFFDLRQATEVTMAGAALGFLHAPSDIIAPIRRCKPAALFSVLAKRAICWGSCSNPARQGDGELSG